MEQAAQGSAPESSAPVTTSTPAPASTPAAPASTPASTPTATPGQTTAAPGPDMASTTPEFKPDYKFKVMDKEHEIEEMYRGLIKDEESYKKIKEMHEKAFGLDSVKKQRDEFRDRSRSHEEKFQEVVGTLKEVGEYATKGDFDSFFESLGVDPKNVYKWVLNKVQYEQLPPEQKAIHDRATEAERRAMQLERQYQQTQTQALESATQARATELQQVLGRPDVAQVMSAYDSRAGKQGAFIDAVIFFGQKAAASGRDISADEAVKEALTLFGTLDQQTAPQGASAPVQTPPANKPPVIPAVQGKGTSPVKRGPKNLDDLRKLRAEMGD